MISASPGSATAAADALLSTMARIRRAGRRQFGRPAELSALTGAQLELLRLVRRRRGVSVAEAAGELGLAANTVSTLVRQLSDAGLMTRRASASDRRVAQLELAPDISRQIDAWRDRRIVALAAAIDELPAAARQLVLDAIPVLEGVAEQVESGGDRV